MNTQDSRNYTISIFIMIILLTLNVFMNNLLIQFIITSLIVIIVVLSISIVIKQKFSSLPKEELFDEED